MKLPLAIAILALLTSLGVGAVVTDFTAYLGDDPATCNNCHVMDAVYESWFHAGHQAWATCNDCHTPHDFIPKYIVKGINGFNHVSAFTLGHIPEAIRAKEHSRRVVQANCIRCHAETVSDIPDGQMDSGRMCFECHRLQEHGPRGISILPYQDKAR
jgi:cytochrome c nitrite reductase small subunit